MVLGLVPVSLPQLVRVRVKVGFRVRVWVELDRVRVRVELDRVRVRV